MLESNEWFLCKHIYIFYRIINILYHKLVIVYSANAGIFGSTFALNVKSYDKPRQHIHKQRHDFDKKGPSIQSYGFTCSHVWIWELDYKESWVPKDWCFWNVVLKTLESPLDVKEIQPVHPEGDQSWLFIERTDAESEAPVLWPPDAKNWLIGKDPVAWKDWR